MDSPYAFCPKSFGVKTDDHLALSCPSVHHPACCPPVCPALNLQRPQTQTQIHTVYFPNIKTFFCACSIARHPSNTSDLISRKKRIWNSPEHMFSVCHVVPSAQLYNRSSKQVDMFVSNWTHRTCWQRVYFLPCLLWSPMTREGSDPKELKPAAAI